MTRRLTEPSTAVAARFVARRERQARLERRKLPSILPPATPRPEPDRRPKHERMPITREQIQQLRAGADPFFARVCDRALADDPHAINACKAAVYGLG